MAKPGGPQTESWDAEVEKVSTGSKNPISVREPGMVNAILRSDRLKPPPDLNC
jgi:hypothetical protein